jgi:chromodomain-helicase-DNA-binding protein 4
VQDVSFLINPNSERIIQTGKKKMVLDHLIVQKMDDGDTAGEDMQSILTYGAQALFDEDQSAQRDIVCAWILLVSVSSKSCDVDTDHDIEKLIEKTEKEGDQQEETKDQGFSFAKIWAADKDDLEEVTDNPADDQGDSWAQALQRIAAVQQQRQVEELTGRGVRRRVAVFPQASL